MLSLTNQIAPFEGNNVGYCMLLRTLWQRIMTLDNNFASAECAYMQRSRVSGSALTIDIDDKEEL